MNIDFEVSKLDYFEHQLCKSSEAVHFIEQAEQTSAACIVGAERTSPCFGCTLQSMCFCKLLTVSSKIEYNKK